MIALALLAAAAAPQPGALKTFADWTVGCDNGRACQAVALVPDGADRDSYLLMVVTRDAAGPALPRLALPTADLLPKGGRVTLRVYGKPVAQALAGAGKDVVLPFNRALATALANGKSAELAGASGRAVARASLSGLAAAFLYIDAQQHRAGTTGALRATGAKPNSSVPTPPPLPSIVSPSTPKLPPRTLSVAAATRLIGPDNATCEYAGGPVRPEAHRLDARHSLVLVPHPCGNGAYNAFASVYIVDEAGRATPADFDAAVGMADEAADDLTNASWDPRTRRLSDYVKGRGLGDCGGSSEFVWDGARFRLVKARAMGECRGSVDFIVTWRARVVTR